MFLCCTSEECFQHNAAVAIDETSRSIGASKAQVARVAPKFISKARSELLSDTLRVVITRESTEVPWGLVLDFADERIVFICDVYEVGSSIGRYNESVPFEEQVQVGDYISSVNGIVFGEYQDAQREPIMRLRDAFSSALALEISVIRPYVFEVTVDKCELSLGLSLRFSSQGCGLIIDDIGPGVIRELCSDVSVGDRIVRVGHAERVPEKLLEALKRNRDPVHIWISRPCTWN